MIWHLLNESGPLAVTKLVKEVDAPRDLVMQASAGWPAKTRSRSRKKPAAKLSRCGRL